MNQSTLKRLLPHLLAYFLMMAISFIFFSPYVFEGKVLTQGIMYEPVGCRARLKKYGPKREKFRFGPTQCLVECLLTNSDGFKGKNLTRIPYGILFLKQSVTKPHTVVLVAMLCCYILLITLGVDWRLSIIGAVGFGLSNYQIDLAEAGTLHQDGRRGPRTGRICGRFAGLSRASIFSAAPCSVYLWRWKF